jgi:predicted nucleic acid-binding Zn ribbon protein
LSVVGTFSASRDQFSRNHRVVDSLCSLVSLNKEEKNTCSEKNEENIKRKRRRGRGRELGLYFLLPVCTYGNNEK